MVDSPRAWWSLSLHLGQEIITSFISTVEMIINVANRNFLSLHVRNQVEEVKC